MVYFTVFVLPVLLVVAVVCIVFSIRYIGPMEVGLVNKRFSFKKLSEDNPIAFNGEAGYQAELLMPGLRFKFWPIFAVNKHPWIQVPAGEIGVVIAQVGKPLPIGAKSAIYKDVFANFSKLENFIENGGQKGVQRPVLSPGTSLPIHPIGFLVITKSRVYGVPVSPELTSRAEKGRILSCENFGLNPRQLDVVRIEPRLIKDKMVDIVGIVTAFEGEPLAEGDIASRIGGFEDIKKLKERNAPDTELMEMILGSKNREHNNYQDFQKFLDRGGRIGLQHDPLLYGAYNLNPFLVSVEIAPMLVVEQGEVAVIKSYVGLPTEDTSGSTFKFGSIVRPGHRGIWVEALRTGKYPLNPHCYNSEIVPTSILNLNWAKATSEAHNLDRNLEPINAKSCEGFIFSIDLQVQIHIPDTQAPRVISMVGTVSNLVNEVLQAAVGNHFRDTLQAMKAVGFIEKRREIQEAATQYITDKLASYNVETKGVYIQDVILPAQLVTVLTEREIANQEIATFKKQQEAQEQRIQTEKSKGTADMQAALAKEAVGVDIEKNKAEQVRVQADAAKFRRTAEGDGEAHYRQATGEAAGAEIRSIGLARAEAAEKLKEALGEQGTMFVNVADALMKGEKRVMPEILVAGGGSSVDGLAAVLMKMFSNKVAADTKAVK
jgi:regulator of protease activity HflC (stomatin/prohibitin superfamily)